MVKLLFYSLMCQTRFEVAMQEVGDVLTNLVWCGLKANQLPGHLHFGWDKDLNQSS